MIALQPPDPRPSTLSLPAAPRARQRSEANSPILAARDVRVHLPASYSADSASGRRYPVVYLLHGFPGGSGDWLSRAHAGETADSLAARGTVPEDHELCFLNARVKAFAEADVLLVVEPHVRAEAGVQQEYIDQRAREELVEIERRRRIYLADRAPIAVGGRTAIVVDDGIATGTTMRAALKGLRRRNPARLVLAVPVAPPETVEELRHDVDDLICLAQPAYFGAIGRFYRDFHQLSDDEVIGLMRQTPVSESTAP